MLVGTLAENEQIRHQVGRADIEVCIRVDRTHRFQVLLADPSRGVKYRAFFRDETCADCHRINFPAYPAPGAVIKATDARHVTGK